MLQTPVNGVPISLTMNCKGYFPFNEMSCVVPILTTWIFSNLNRMDSRPKIRRRTFNKSKELDGVSLKEVSFNTLEGYNLNYTSFKNLVVSDLILTCL